MQMEKTYLNFIENLQQADWDYHDNRCINNPFVTDIGHKSFIEKYFFRAGKRDLVKNFFNECFEPKRPEHVNSTFFLGLIHIKHANLNEHLKFEGVNPSGYPKLPFIWFLDTLFHDFGMNQEKVKELSGELKNVNSIDDLYAYYNVENKLLDNTHVDGIPSELFEAIPNYFKYKLSQGRIDHGIQCRNILL